MKATVSVDQKWVNNLLLVTLIQCLVPLLLFKSCNSKDKSRTKFKKIYTGLGSLSVVPYVNYCLIQHHVV